MHTLRTKLGRFRCCSCSHEFRLRPGGHDESHCPACGSIYYAWLDFERFMNTTKPVTPAGSVHAPQAKTTEEPARGVSLLHP